MKRRLALWTTLGCSTWAVHAAGSLLQPDGVEHPNAPNSAEIAVVGSASLVSLGSLFAARGESIEWFDDARPTPGTFVPLTPMTAQLVLRGGGCALDFGWYNVVSSGTTPPLDSEVYTLIPKESQSGSFDPLVGDPPEPVYSIADITLDENYLGGRIAFALRGRAGTVCTQTNYTHQIHNRLCTSCTPQGNWIMAAIWRSTLANNAFYIGFEDLPTTATSFQAPGTYMNDGDFNDFVFYVTGIAETPPCALNEECSNNLCIQGVCCDAACTGACESCRGAHTGGSDGECLPIVAGADPKDACAAQSTASCGTTGACNGTSRQCALYPAGTICVESVGCATATSLDVADECNGTGSCVTMPNLICDAGYACSAGSCHSSCTDDDQCAATYICKSSGTCLPESDTSCEAHSDCASSAWCNLNLGQCRPKKALGIACSQALECASNFCVDGVCCDSECTGECTACSNATKGIGADGLCAPVAAGLDPSDECAPDIGFPASCGADGACDGQGACRQFAPHTIACGVTTCSEGVTEGMLCDGSGTCAENSGVACHPYECSGTTCAVFCITNVHCAQGAYCAPSGICVTTLPDGSSCAEAAECMSGQCIRGVCCESSCSGACQACDVSGSEGQCVVVAGQPEVGVCEGSGTPCAGSCDGSSAECTYPGAETSCGTEGTCSEGTCVDDPGVPLNPVTGAQCLNATTSRASNGTETACDPYTCDVSTGQCRVACVEQSDCAPGLWCYETNVCNTLNNGDGGCGCRASRGDASGWAWLSSLLVLSALRVRRRLRAA